MPHITIFTWFLQPHLACFLLQNAPNHVIPPERVPAAGGRRGAGDPRKPPPGYRAIGKNARVGAAPLICYGLGSRSQTDPKSTENLSGNGGQPHCNKYMYMYIHIHI